MAITLKSQRYILENLERPAIAEIRYITKEKIIVNDVKQIYYKVGLYIKEKLPAETIFALTKYINKKRVRPSNRHRTLLTYQYMKNEKKFLILYFSF